MAEQALYELKKKLKILGAKRGRHTELISVYIPDGYDISKITNKLAEEQGTASNIKSASTRKNVTTALTKMVTLIEPAVLVFMGIVIGILVVSMFLPIFQLAMVSRGG